MSIFYIPRLSSKEIIPIFFPTNSVLKGPSSQYWYHQTLDLCRSKVRKILCFLFYLIICEVDHPFVYHLESFRVPLLWTFYSYILLTILVLTYLALSYFKNSLYTGDIRACPNFVFQKFSQFAFAFSLYLLTFSLSLSFSPSLSLQKFKYLYAVQVKSFLLRLLDFIYIMLGKVFPTLRLGNSLLVFFSSTFVVSLFYLLILFHLELIFM